MTDDKPTVEEALAAGALARALEGEGGPEVPEEALQAAALLRFSADGGELSGERSAAILDELLAEAEPASRPAPMWRRWRLYAGGLAAAASLVVVFAVLQRSTPVSPGPTDLPRPEVALLNAQSRAARPGQGGLAPLGAEMSGYRTGLYASLIANYEEEHVR